VGAKIRMIEPDQVYEASIRTVDRTFLFSPNHRKSYPLLAASSPPSTLSLDNDVIPDPSIINVIGAAVGRALVDAPIQIHGFEANINHLHLIFSATQTQLDNIIPFFQTAFSLIARGVNRSIDREGPVFNGRMRAHACLSEETAEQKLLYAITNAAKDNLIERTEKSPLFTTYHYQAKGEPLKYWYIDYDAYWTAGGSRKKTHRLKDYLKWTKWHCTPLPNQQSKSISERQTWMRQQVKDLEMAFAEQRKERGRTVIGEKCLRETDPRDRPKNPKKSGPEPLCHASDKETAKAYKEKWRHFKNEHIKASADYRNGMRDREFPIGSFKPPLLDVAKAGSH
jgi:hypothetical protein